MQIAAGGSEIKAGFRGSLCDFSELLSNQINLKEMVSCISPSPCSYWFLRNSREGSTLAAAPWPKYENCETNWNLGCDCGWEDGCDIG